MESKPQGPDPFAMTLPNQITIARLVISILLFIFVPLQLYIPALIAFVVAAGTDWVDGILQGSIT